MKIKIARGIRDQNGFEFWRLLHRELAPEKYSKSLIWRRTLLSPKFPSKENEFSAALQEWEADLDKYEAEYGTDKAISDEDKRAVVIALKPHQPWNNMGVGVSKNSGTPKWMVYNWKPY